jgi:hypothetical protein
LFISFFYCVANVILKGRFTAPIHKVPNLCIGKWGTHNMIRAFIPELYDEERASPILTQQEYAAFYEKGLRPAVWQLDDNDATEWPATYNDEMFRARSKAGHLSFQTKVMDTFVGWFLADYIRDALKERGSNWHHGLVFLHQVRGVKNSCRHHEENAAASLEQFFNKLGLDLQQIRQSDAKCWIDVGLEVQSTAPFNDCLAWRTDSHFHLVKDIFGIPENHAQRITSVGSSQYSRDLTSLLPAVSGCRITPGTLARGPYDIQYFHLYLTEKALIYRLDKGRYGKFITCAEILSGKASQHIDSLYNLYRNAIETNSTLARAEARVPLGSATDVLLGVTEGLLRESLVAIPGSVYW